MAPAPVRATISQGATRSATHKRTHDLVGHDSLDIQGLQVGGEQDAAAGAYHARGGARDCEICAPVIPSRPNGDASIFVLRRASGSGLAAAVVRTLRNRWTGSLFQH